MYPYRTVFPKATMAEYMKKNVSKGEKTIRCYELVDPYINVAAVYRNEDEEDSDDEDEGKFNAVNHISFLTRFLSYLKVLLQI